MTQRIVMTNKNLEDIIKENAPNLHMFVRSRVSNRDDADDIVQDTFYQFLRAISIMDNPVGKVSSWLYTVAHNLIVNHGKKHREVEMPRRMFDDEDDSFMTDISEIMAASDDDNPEIQLLRTMVWDELGKALASLPDEQRMAVEMTEIRGLSVREAAQQMGVPVNTFLSRKHYAVKHIRRRLFGLYEELVGNK